MPVLTGEQMVGDRASQSGVTGQVFGAKIGFSEDEQLNVLVVGLRLVRRPETSLELQDIAPGR
jgi:hypothetical protein